MDELFGLIDLFWSEVPLAKESQVWASAKELYPDALAEYAEWVENK